MKRAMSEQPRTFAINSVVARLRTAYKSLLFAMVKRIVLKHFRDGLRPIFSSRKNSTEIIAYTWTFENDNK